MVAEAHAAAARDCVMAELVTKTGLEAAPDRVSLRITVRLSGMLAISVAILSAIIKSFNLATGRGC